MKYMYINDFTNVLIKKWKAMFLYFVCLIFVSFFTKFILYDANTDTVILNLGLDFNFDKNLLYLVIFMFIKTFPIYLSLYLFLKDIKTGVDNIFVRITKIKWVCIKLLSIASITLIIKLLSHMLVYSIYNLMLNNSVEHFISDVILTISIQLIVLTLYSAFYKYKIIVGILVIGILVTIFNNFTLITSIFYIDKLVITSLLFLTLIIIYIYLVPKTLIELFERSK